MVLAWDLKNACLFFVFSLIEGKKKKKKTSLKSIFLFLCHYMYFAQDDVQLHTTVSKVILKRALLNDVTR